MHEEIECPAPAHLHIERHGNGSPLVLAHGFAGSARNFLPQARVQSRTRRVWLYDARGHARSEAPSNEQVYGWDFLTSDLNFVINESRGESTRSSPPRIVVGGLSLGAATALFWALRHQTVVEGLVLAAYPDSTESMRNWALDFAWQIEQIGADSAGYQFIWGPHGRFGVKDSRLIRLGFLEHPAKALVAVLRQAMAQIPDISTFRRELEQFHVPTLVVVGANDSNSLAASRLVADAIPNARLTIIEDAGHVVNLSQPAAFNQELANFISGL